MPTVLICGSRHWSPADTSIVKAYVYARVRGIKENGLNLIAGDAPGVDQWVAEAARTAGMSMEVVGIAPAPRHGIYDPTYPGDDVPNITYTQMQQTLKFQRSSSGRYAYGYMETPTYRDRDRYMVKEADMCLAIWNGTSSGTKAVYQYGLEQGKQCWLVMAERIRAHAEKQIG